MNTAKLQIQLLTENQQNTLYKTKISSIVFSCLKEQIHATFKIGFIITTTKLVRLKTIQKAQQKN